MSASGALIAESLEVGAVLDGVALTVRRVSRADVGDVSAGQPRTWTFLEFEVADGDAVALAERLTRVLDPALGWYCDFRSPAETFVAFGGRYFRYPRGDRSARAEVEEHARRQGVPEAQLDWPE